MPATEPPRPASVIPALERYYRNCDASNESYRANKLDPSVKWIKWDKAADIDNVFACAKADGFDRQEACAGSFWFSAVTIDGNYVVHMVQRNYRTGGDRSFVPKGKGFGSMAMITDALDKQGRTPVFINANER